MLNLTTLARPYARAAFQAASAHDEVADWSQCLAIAAQVATEEPVPRLLEDPRLTREQILGVFEAAVGDLANERFVRFLDTLSQYRRLSLLPEIWSQFEALRRESEERVHVLVVSAHEMSDDEAVRLSNRLKERFQREIDLEVEIDPSLIGGAIIRARDQVIDGSVRGQLKRLARQVAA